MTFALRHVTPPAEPPAYARPVVPAAEHERRIAALYEAARADWVVVYGDREHAANLAFLTGFDPRFEEALLLLGPGGRRVLAVGNEGLGYVSQAAVPLEVALCQTLSLMGQPRDDAPRLSDLLAGNGVSGRIAVVGWKYLEPEEDDEPAAPAFVPAFLVAALRRLGEPFEATQLLAHPSEGLKSRSTAAQIAQYAWAAERSSQAALRVVRGARPGMTELEAAGLMGYEGEPLSCHVMLASAGPGHPVVGLRSPGGRRLREGDGLTTAIGYQGGLCCRAGLLARGPDESFAERFVKPYYAAIAAWWRAVRIGVTGGELHAAVLGALAGAEFRPALNPGHLIALDEWSHSPVRPGSREVLASGMALQCDIIPAPAPDGWALNCEDGIALADEALRAELAAEAPELWARVQARRTWMREALGIVVAEEVLPLSAAPAWLCPFWLAPELACVA